MSDVSKQPVRINHIKRIVGYAAVDAFIVYISYTVLFFARVIATPPENYLSGLIFTLFSAAMMVSTLYLFRVYHRVWDRTSGQDVAVILYAAVIASAIVLALDIVIADPLRPLPISVIVFGNAMALLAIVAVRYRFRLVAGMAWRWRVIWRGQLPQKNTTRVLVVGAGESGSAFVWRLKHRWEPDHEHKFNVVGYIDDDPAKRGLIFEGVSVVGNRHEIPEIVAKRNVNLIVIAIHNISGPDFREVLGYCEGTAARIKVVPDMYAMLNQRLGVATLRDVQPEDVLGRKLVGRHKSVDLSPVMGKAVLVTGAAGSIGSELCRQMTTYEPTRLLLLDNNESGLHDLYTELKAQYPALDLVPVLADISQRETIKKVFGLYQPQIVFHAAAYKHVPMLELFPHESVRVNIGGTRNLAELARDNGVERFVLISTDKAVDPSCVMGASKRAAELLMKALSEQQGHHTLFTAVRFGNVLGSRGSVAPTFNRQIDKGGPVTVTHQDMQRYFMTIAEAVNLVIHAAAMTNGGDLFMLRMGEEVRIVELAERMIRMRGLRPYKDIEIKFSGTRPGEKLNEKLRRDDELEIPTVHSHIVRLENHELKFDGDQFLSQIADMVEREAHDLLDLPGTQPPASSDRAEAYSMPDQQHVFLKHLVRIIDQTEAPGPKLVRPDGEGLPVTTSQWRADSGQLRGAAN